MIGRAVGPYRIVKLLGVNLGNIYLAEDASGEKVIIKIFHFVEAGKAAVEDASAQKAFVHDNAVRFFDTGFTENGLPYLAFEYLNGQSLDELLKDEQPLPISRAGAIVLQCCRALQAAEERGFVHPELKPHDIILVKQGERADFIKMVGFTPNPPKKTRYPRIPPPAYISPEQIAGNAADGRSSIYTLGVILFQMLTGKLPFPARPFKDAMLAHLQRPPPRPSVLNPELPADVEAIILKMLAKAPKDRYQSMAELHETLLGCMERLGISTGLPFLCSDS